MKRLKSFLLLTFLLSSILKANTKSVDTNSITWGMTIPLEFTYLAQKDGGKTYLFNPLHMGIYIGYEEWELHTQIGLANGMCYFDSSSLENHPNLAAYSYGSSLLYYISTRTQLGSYFNKTVFISENNYNSYEKGDFTDYGLKLVYNPNQLNYKQQKRSLKSNYTFSLGYTNGTDIKSVSNKREYLSHRLQNVRTEKKIDLSGYTISLGIILKF